MDLMETARNTPRHDVGAGDVTTTAVEGVVPGPLRATTQLQVLALGKAKEAMNVAEMKGRLVPSSGFGGGTKGTNKNQNLPLVDADGPDINYDRVFADGKGRETAGAAAGQRQEPPGINYSKGGHQGTVADEKIMQQQFNMVKGGNGKAKGPGSSKKGGDAKGMLNNDQFLQLNPNSDSRGRSTSAQPTKNSKMLKTTGSTAAAAPAPAEADQDQVQVQDQEYLLSLSTSKEKQETLVSNISKDAQSFIAHSPEPGSLSPVQRMHRLRQLRAKQERARALLDDLLAANDYAARKRKVLRQQAASNVVKCESTSKNLGKQAKGGDEHHGKDVDKVNNKDNNSTGSCSTSTPKTSASLDKEEQEKLLEQEEKLAMQRIQGIFDVIADLDKEEKQFIEGSLKAKRDSGVVSIKSEESTSYPPAIIALGTSNNAASSTGRFSSSSGLDSAGSPPLSPLTLLAKTKQSSASCFEEPEERSSAGRREEQLISNISGGDIVGVKKGTANELTLNLKGGIMINNSKNTESEEDLYVGCDDSTTRTNHPITEKKDIVNKNKQSNMKTDTSTFLTPAAYDYHHPCPLVLTRIGTSAGAGGQSIMMKEAAPSAKQGAAAGSVLPNNKGGAGERAASNKGGRGIMYNDMAARRGATTASAPAQEDQHSQQVGAGRNINVATNSATTAKTNKKTTTSTSRVVEQKNQTNKVVKNITHHDRKHSSTSTVRSSETPSVIEPPPGLEAQQPQMSVKNQLACVIGENNDERSPTWSMEIYMEGLHKKTPPRGAGQGQQQHIRSKSYCADMIQHQNGFEKYNFNTCPAPAATPTRAGYNHAPSEPFYGKRCNSSYPATRTAVSVSPVNGSTPDSLGCTTASGKSNNSAVDNAEKNFHSIKHVAGTKGYFAGKVENFYLHPGSSMLTPSAQKRSKSMHVEQLFAPGAGGPPSRTPVVAMKGGGGAAGGVSTTPGKTNGKIGAETSMKGSGPASVLLLSPSVSGKNGTSAAGKEKNPSGQQAAAQDNKPATAKGGKGTSKGSKNTNPRSKSYHFGDQVRLLAMAHYGVGWNGKQQEQQYNYNYPAGVDENDATTTALLHQKVKEVGKGGKMKNMKEQQGASATARDGITTVSVDKISTHENHYKIIDEDADNEIIEWPCTSNSEEEAGATWAGYKKSRRERLYNIAHLFKKIQILSFV